MRTIIAGSRDFNDVYRVSTIMEGVGSLIEISSVVSGTARGADQMGEAWAKARDIPVVPFPADWEKYGKSAGYVRNTEMAKYADALIAFWDGESKGTKHMIDIALAQGLMVLVWNFSVKELSNV